MCLVQQTHACENVFGTNRIKKKNSNSKEKICARSGVRTHAVNRLLELESNPLDLSGILATQTVMHHSGIEPESSAWKADILTTGLMMHNIYYTNILK